MMEGKQETARQKMRRENERLLQLDTMVFDGARTCGMESMRAVGRRTVHAVLVLDSNHLEEIHAVILIIPS